MPKPHTRHRRTFRCKRAIVNLSAHSRHGYHCVIFPIFNTSLYVHKPTGYRFSRLVLHSLQIPCSKDLSSVPARFSLPEAVQSDHGMYRINVISSYYRGISIQDSSLSKLVPNCWQASDIRYERDLPVFYTRPSSISRLPKTPSRHVPRSTI